MRARPVHLFVVLLLIGLQFDQYYDPELPGTPTLPGGLNANKLQTGMDLGLLVVFVRCIYLQPCGRFFFAFKNKKVISSFCCTIYS